MLNRIISVKRTVPLLLSSKKQFYAPCRNISVNVNPPKLCWHIVPATWTYGHSSVRIRITCPKLFPPNQKEEMAKTSLTHAMMPVACPLEAWPTNTQIVQHLPDS
ncbi:hypothetical protein DPMN_106424 [Dreissena polymorpha]|uniref:Uncharacterized protein n=1 Tax=Dreissena polymorpha TaxID=45954 RepID=A0A9D4K4Y4_DREPO|nr:hypothetical protein DPMN_106424 [Dreissena polymorpha]